jgi:16S rRNA processing protein RimM
MSRSTRTKKQSEWTTTGSPQAGGPVFLVVGTVGRPHGLRGELQFHALTDFPERLAPGLAVFIGPAYAPYEIRGIQEHGQKYLLRLDGIDSRESAEILRNARVFVRTDSIPPLEDGEYYQHQVLGLQVQAESGEQLGAVSEIISTGANDVLVVLGDGGEILVPRLDDVVLKIDLKAGLITVRLPKGLLP